MTIEATAFLFGVVMIVGLALATFGAMLRNQGLFVLGAILNILGCVLWIWGGFEMGKHKWLFDLPFLALIILVMILLGRQTRSAR